MRFIMIPKIVHVVPSKDFELLLTFENHEKRVFNVKPYLNLGAFSELKNEDLFKTVKISYDTVAWVNGVDIDPEELYKNSRKVKK